MQFATTTQLPTLPNGFCSDINATTDNIQIGSFFNSSVFTGYWPTIGSIPGSYETSQYEIVRAFFEKYPIGNAPELPAGLEHQKVYYLRKTGTNVKVYSTFAAAQSETSHIDFTTNANGYLFSIYFLDIAYRYLNGWSPGAATLEEIPCCPDVPAVFTDCPNAGVTSYAGGNRNLIRFIIETENPNNVGYAYGSLNSYGFPVSFNNNRNPDITTFNVYINHYFENFYGPYSPVNKPGIIIYFVSTVTNQFGLYYFGRLFYQADSINLPTTTFTLMDIVDDLILANQTNMTDVGLIPETISITYSGKTDPPPQIRVSLPDAHFENYTYTTANGYNLKHINLGFIDEVLTYDHDTRTYWGGLKNYAGIDGRIHFSIPNFYPLLSSGVKYIDSGINYTIQNNNFNSGEFPRKLLNDYSNAEFNFYKTLDLLNINSNPSYPGEPGDNFLRMFLAADDYGGYQTGLPVGTIWIDSRVVLNLTPTIVYPENLIKRKSARIALAFSRWGEAKFRRTNISFTEQQGDSLAFNHYHQNIFYIKSVHPNAYITSLGV